VSAFRTPLSSRRERVYQIIEWAGGTVFGVIIWVVSVIATGFAVNPDPTPGSMFWLVFTLVFTSLGVIIFGFFARRLPMLIAAGISFWTLLSGITGLINTFENIFAWALPAAVAIQIFLFLWLTKLR
jgi:hypothetical protein